MEADWTITRRLVPKPKTKSDPAKLFPAPCHGPLNLVTALFALVNIHLEISRI